jgi:hypothetical protein
MATHGEKPRPPAGRFDGRLWGAFHGHRHLDPDRTRPDCRLVWVSDTRARLRAARCLLCDATLCGGMPTRLEAFGNPPESRSADAVSGLESRLRQQRWRR